MSFFDEPQIWQKITMAETLANDFLVSPANFCIPHFPARDVKVVLPEELPPKKGLSQALGRARLLHDLASIELQAFELCFRTLVEFPQAPSEFREQLLAIGLSEAKHLKLCLKGLDHCGFQWGDWPVHIALWKTVSSEDSLLDRILIVHRYLEGSGLDAGDTLLRRLYGAEQGVCYQIVKEIVEEEIAHVEFGNRWYRQVCNFNQLDPEMDFKQRMNELRQKVPRRIEPISYDLRRRSGFTEEEILHLAKMREQNKANKGVL